LQEPGFLWRHVFNIGCSHRGHGDGYVGNAGKKSDFMFDAFYILKSKKLISGFCTPPIDIPTRRFALAIALLHALVSIVFGL